MEAQKISRTAPRPSNKTKLIFINHVSIGWVNKKPPPRATKKALRYPQGFNIKHQLSLNSKTDGDGADGEPSEIIDFLADDNAIDIVARLDARRCLQGMPRRLVQIAYKRYSGIPLTDKEWHYFKYHRQKELKKYQQVLGF